MEIWHSPAPEWLCQRFLSPHPSSLTGHPCPRTPSHTFSSETCLFVQREIRVMGQLIPSSPCPVPTHVHAFSWILPFSLNGICIRLPFHSKHLPLCSASHPLYLLSGLAPSLFLHFYAIDNFFLCWLFVFNLQIRYSLPIFERGKEREKKKGEAGWGKERKGTCSNWT